MGRGQDLLDAARKGDERSVEKILIQITKRSGPFTSLSLRRGAGVNVQDDNGYTPLHHACLQGHKEIVSLLLNVDANPCVVDKMGATALHLASWKGDAEIVAMLLAHNNPKVDVNQLTLDQETALIMAAQYGFVNVVAQLIAKGADVSIRNIKGDSALDLAAQYGRLSTVKHLIQGEPALIHPYKYPNWRNHKFCTTPLHRASKNGHKDVVQVLLRAGIDPNIRTNSGTPLHEAACFGKAAVVEVLLRAGADLRATDSRDKTVEDLLADYSEEVTRQVRWAIQVHKNKGRNNYESEDDVPPFPVDYSPTSYHGPAVLYDNIQDRFLSNANIAMTNLNIDNKCNVSNAIATEVIGPSLNIIRGHRMRSFTYSNPRTTEVERAAYLIKYNLLKNNKIVKQPTVYENVSNPHLNLLKTSYSNSLPKSMTRKKRPKPSPKPQVHNINVENIANEMVYENPNYPIYNNLDVNANDNGIYENISDDAKAQLSNEKPEYAYYVDINASQSPNVSVIRTLSNDPAQNATVDSYIDMSGNKDSAVHKDTDDIMYFPMHRKGDVGCKYYNKENPYFTFYALNADTKANDYPFQEEKQKLERLPCYCQSTEASANISEDIYYSCENFDLINDEEKASSAGEDRTKHVFKKKFNKLTQRLTNYF